MSLHRPNTSRLSTSRLPANHAETAFVRLAREIQAADELERQLAADFWQCEACGSNVMQHVQAPDPRGGGLAWYNRCLACKRDSEYLPSPAEIAQATARIRAETGRVPVDDQLEQFWREIAAEQLKRRADEDELSELLDDLPDDADSPELQRAFTGQPITS